MNRLVLVLSGLALAACSADAPPEHYAVILAGGTVYAGADAEPVVADVAIEGDRIVAVGELSGAEAALRLDVSGLAVTPGFIDIHSHALRETPETSGLFLYPDAENLIRQGVTTVIGGPDGGSPLPIGDSLAMIEASPASVNFATFVGHGSIRELVVGPDDRAPTPEELEAMKQQVAKAMQEGAYGLSSGLVYAPGKFATTEEVIELARVAGEYGGIYISHMREEGLELLASVAETIRIGEEGGLPTQLTHHKVVGAPMWGKSAETLAMVDAAIERGVDVSIDQYPYTASSTSLAILFPRWALDGDRETRLARLADPEQRAEVRAVIVRNIEVDRGGNDPANIVLADCTFDRSLNGLNLSQVLARNETGITFDNAAELVISLFEAGNCSAVFHAMEEEDVTRIMRHPKTMIASDGGVEAPSERAPHPRNYGTFARVLGRYVREQGLMPLQTAVYKMSMLPADRIELSDRGRIEAGAKADIAVFDAAEVIDTATFENPHQYALGMRHVFVNGVPVLLNAEMTGERPGRVLRSR